MNPKVLGVWDQAAHDWWEENRYELPPEEIELGVVVPASGAAETLQMVYHLAQKWVTKAGGEYFPGYFIPPLLFGLAERFRFREPVRELSPNEQGTFDLTDIPDEPTELKRALRLRKQVKRGWRIGVSLSVAGQLNCKGRGRVAAWKIASKARTDAHRKFMGRDDTETDKVIKKREKSIELYWIQREFLVPKIASPEFGTGMHILNPPCFSKRKHKSLSAAVKERKRRTHSAAGLNAEKINHNCLPHCQCHMDPEPFRNWRPWDNPPAEHVAEWESWYEGAIPAELTLRLKRILWVFRGAEPDGEYNEKSLFCLSREPSERRRFQLRSWVNGVARPHKYARPWECYKFRKAAPMIDNPDEGHDDGEVGGTEPGRMVVNIAYTIVTREHRREVKIPGYSLHDSWQDVMKHLGCSRRTAFRKIREGYKIGGVQ